MKTKIKYFIFIFILSFFSLKNVSALSQSDGLIKLTSGLKYTYYKVEWCSPHGGGVCKERKFQKYGNIGKMSYKGENSLEGSVLLNYNIPSTTRTTSENLINFFDGITEVQFEGEGTYKVIILLVDYAYNASKFEFTYKIDKTAPQFKIIGMSENSPNIYIHTDHPRVTGINGNVVKYDSTK